jgi:hypothetical protein
MKLNRRLWLAAPAAAFAVALLAGPAGASTVDIVDDANVLNATTVQNEAATLPVPILIWTTTQDAANRSAFDNDVRAKVTSSFPVVLGINTQAHHETLQMGSRAGLSQSAAVAAESSANSAFDNAMKSQNNYTSAVTAALTSLRGSLANRGGSGTSSRSSSSAGGFVTFAIIVVVLIVIVLVVRRFRPRRRTMMPGPMMGGGFNQGGYGPPQGYGPGYGPGYGGGGMGPGAAGAIGAVGGGLVGYELGKMAGENEQFRRDEMMGNGGYDNQNYGDQGGGGNDWVVGQDSDFGGGGGDFGGGGDSGGGGGGDW